MDSDRSKIVCFEDLSAIRERHPGERLVLCHGVFDLLHVGHLEHFETAHQFGDRLIVSLTPDEFVNKGPGRPYYNVSQRLKMVGALEAVDYVVINQHPHAIELIDALRPDVFVKGAEFQSGRDVTGAIQKEKTAIESYGGRIEFTHDEAHSSGQLLNRFFGIWDKNQSAFIDTLKDRHNPSNILDLVQAFSSKRVLVLGEPIIDHYVFCAPKSLSSKSPSVSVQRLYEEEYPGGVLAVANHLASLGCQVDLLVADNGGEAIDLLLEKGLDDSVNLEREKMEFIPTVRKTRFVAEFQSEKLFEVFDERSFK
jgi:rfaE bifunctional protein nucleotidyltransferase chain/domain